MRRLLILALTTLCFLLAALGPSQPIFAQGPSAEDTKPTYTPSPTVAAESTPVLTTAVPQPTATPGFGGDMYEPDDPPPSVPVAASHQRVFAPQGDVDRGTFQIKAGYGYRVFTASGPSVDPAMTVYVDGTSYSDNDGGAGNDSQVTFTAQAAGHATYETTSYNGVYGPSAGYAVEIVEIEPDYSHDPCEPNEPCHYAAPSGECQPRSFGHQGDEDRTLFTAKAGDRYQIETRDLAGGVDTRIGLYDDSGNLLDVDDDDGQGLGSLLVFDAPDNRTYLVHIVNLRPVWGPQATYGVCLTSSSELPTATPTVTPMATATAQATWTPIPAQATWTPKPPTATVDATVTSKPPTATLQPSPTSVPVQPHQGVGSSVTATPIVMVYTTGSSAYAGVGGSTVPSGGTSGGVTVTTSQSSTAASAASAAAPASITLMVYVDQNGDSIMNPEREGATGIVGHLYAYQGGDRFERFVGLNNGAGGTSIEELPRGTTIYVALDYLTRSVSFPLETGEEHQVVVTLPSVVLPTQLP